MKTKNVAAMLAAAAAACVVSAGTAHADVPAFNTPFVDPGCVCAGLLPGPLVMQAFRGDHVISTDLRSRSGAFVLYGDTHEALTDIGADAEDKAGAPVQYGTYRGRPSFTTVPFQHDNRLYQAVLVFMDGRRAFVLTGVGETADDAQGALDVLRDTFQII
ncbi:hypothetical protein [Nocardia stercoris]|uniref:DUF3558 domain-containing protein n=1 Tax=Nocardia stercoris TaxID=2483361 RepID=A0A3M2KRM1_9NOCA|nr:hypothetical protein [Nocardia stercoris]RMI27721.1 hypothetical protein EBN03_33165 [Nocardia stercoris]